MSEFKVARSGETESEFRQFLAQIFTQGAFLKARTGIIGATGLGVAQTTTASSSVVVDAGMAVVQDTTLNGAAPLINDTAKTLDILGSNPMGGLPRNDVVVFDAATESIRNIVGTPAAVPTDPTVPATAVPLARLRHEAGATTVPASAVDSLRVWTAMRGGITPANDQADRDSLFARAGTAVFRQDTDALEVFDGSAWRVYGQTSSAKAAKRTHWGTATVSTDSSGYATVTHGAGFTPTSVVLTGTTITWRIMADNFTSTSFRVKTFNGSGTGVPLVGVKFSYFCGE